MATGAGAACLDLEDDGTDLSWTPATADQVSAGNPNSLNVPIFDLSAVNGCVPALKRIAVSVR